MIDSPTAIPRPDVFPMVASRCARCQAAECICARMRVEPCACGGPDIVAPRYARGADPVIAAAVWHHNLTPEHRAWRDRGAQPAEDGPTAALSPVDVSEELPGASGRPSPAGAVR